jgi:hypothetical protein
MLRRILLILLGLVIVLLVVADRVGAVVAGHVLADKIQTDEHLANRPDVHVGGVPFLTQAFAGKYSDVTVTAHNLQVDDVPVSKLVAHLHGAHIPFGKAVSGNVHRVPIDRTDGTVTVTYADIDRYLADKHLTVGPGSNGTVAVTAEANAGGTPLTAKGTGAVSVSGNVVHVTVTKVSGGVGSVQGSVNTAVGFSLPLTGLPFQISLAHVTVTSAGLVATGTVHHLVLGS